jgi:hypothetical protein
MVLICIRSCGAKFCPHEMPKLRKVKAVSSFLMLDFANVQVSLREEDQYHIKSL